MNFNCRKLFQMIPVVFLLVVGACAQIGKGLITLPASDQDVGNSPFTVILYSTSEHQYLETAAFLDLETDGYELQPYGASFNYTVVKGLTGPEALRRAREFIDHRVINNRIELRAIEEPEGTVVGYELRPLQLPINYGESDVLNISYFLRQEGRIIIYIQLKERIQRLFERPNDRY